VAVHHNFQRCYTIHHTDGLVMQRNIGYKTKGHCFFLEGILSFFLLSYDST
jgi:cell migration-inducing and hyaluronan-binding protein